MDETTKVRVWKEKARGNDGLVQVFFFLVIIVKFDKVFKIQLSI